MLTPSLMLLKKVLAMTNPNDAYPEIRTYLEIMNRAQSGPFTGMLGVVAAKAKVSEGELREIVLDGKAISDEIAAAIAAIIE